jgi:hypothetical protein
MNSPGNGVSNDVTCQHNKRFWLVAWLFHRLFNNNKSTVVITHFQLHEDIIIYHHGKMFLL